LLLLYPRVDGRSEVLSVTLLLLYVRVGCINDVSPVIIVWVLVMYVVVCLWRTDLYLRWMDLRGLYYMDVGWLCLISHLLLPSSILIVEALISRPLWSSWMLWWHPRRWGALHVFWARSKKLV
jgi:hypothetical protein